MQKKHLFSKTGLAAGILSAAVVSSSALGAGFEKNVLWSGKWVGVGGAAVSGVQGAESLFFNPAGLAGHQGFEVSGNFSPTWGQFKGPIGTANIQESTGYKFSPVFGALVNYGITPQWSIGVGSFVSAGTKAEYQNVGNFSANFPADTTGNVRSSLYAVEYSIGTGYELIPGLKVGAAWRIIHVNAGIDTPYVSGSALTTRLNFATLDSLSGTRYNGFRLGAQYMAPDKKWGLGATWRSSVDFTVKGSASIRSVAPVALGGGTTTATADNVTASSSLPTQIEVGGNYAVLDAVRLYLDYVWTNYSHNQELPIVGGGIQSFNLGWMNQSNVRIGTECTAVPDWTFRAGYVYTSQVVPAMLARATFSSPGTGNTVTVGAGKQLMDKMLDVDAAFERSWASGTTTPADQTNYGDYSTGSWALHLGATYRL